MCENWNVRQATSQQVFKVTTFCTDTCFQSFSPLINCTVHHTLLKFSPCRNKTLPQLVRIADWYWYSIHALLQHAPDAVIYRVEVRTVCWPATRTDELGCLTAQKLDSVMSTMCWRTVLLEDKHVSSNAADSLVAASAVLRQQHVSLMFAACAKMSLVQPSLDTVRLTTACVSSTNLRYGRVLEASCCDMG